MTIPGNSILLRSRCVLKCPSNGCRTNVSGNFDCESMPFLTDSSRDSSRKSIIISELSDQLQLGRLHHVLPQSIMKYRTCRCIVILIPRGYCLSNGSCSMYSCGGSVIFNLQIIGQLQMSAEALVNAEISNHELLPNQN